MALHALFMQPAVGDAAIDYTAQEFRQNLRSLLTLHTGVPGEEGVTTAAGYAVTQRGAGANLSVDVAAGSAYVVGDDVTNQGTYFVWLDGTQNVTGVTVPGAGTYHHRVCLQIQDKLSNGAYSGYVGNLILMLDSGGGLPANPASAITLATIDIPSGSASVTNAMITDYRQRAGGVAVYKTADTSRPGPPSYTDDPDLQLLNLQANAQYRFAAHLSYTSAASGALGDIQWKFRVSSGTTMSYTAPRQNASGNVTAGFGFGAVDGVTGQTPSPNATLMGAPMIGAIATGAAPAYVVLQWGQNTNAAANTIVKSGSLMEARRVA